MSWTSHDYFWELTGDEHLLDLVWRDTDTLQAIRHLLFKVRLELVQGRVREMLLEVAPYTEIPHDVLVGVRVVYQEHE